MGMIRDLGEQLDNATVDYLQAVFSAVAEPVQTLMQSIGIVVLLFIAVNHVIQAREIHYSKYLNWGVTYILVVSFATVWSNFSVILNALEGITQGYANLVIEAVAKDIQTLRADILDPSLITGAGELKTYAAMDEFAHAIIWIAGDFLRDTSILDLGKTFRNIFSGALIIIVGGIFTAAGAIIVLISKVGMIVAISMAPLGIMMFMWEKTRQYFQSWLTLLIGFAVIPLLIGCLMAIVLYFAGHILATSGASSFDKDKFWIFVFVMIAALVLLFQLPTMAQTLAQASVAVGGASVARAMAGATGASNLKNYGLALPSRALGQAFDPRKYAHATGAMAAAAKSGASPMATLRSGFGAFRRHTDDRKAFWRNRREQNVVGSGQMQPNPAFQSVRPPNTSNNSAGASKNSTGGEGSPGKPGGTTTSKETTEKNTSRETTNSQTNTSIKKDETPSARASSNAPEKTSSKGKGDGSQSGTSPSGGGKTAQSAGKEEPASVRAGRASGQDSGSRAPKSILVTRDGSHGAGTPTEKKVQPKKTVKFAED